MSEFYLTVPVPVEEFSYMERRLKYLEAMLIRVVRDKRNIQEWFAAPELAAKRLNGLPTTPEAVSRKARQEGWRYRRAKFRNTWFNSYHVTSLPARAFDDLLSRILALPGIDVLVPVLPDIPDMPAPLKPEAENTAPPWVLPLMRILKTEAAGDIAEAWSLLPERLPPGVPLPTVEEAAKVLVELGLAG